MKKFKDLFTESQINESTRATITTFINGAYKTSILQADGYDKHMKPELNKYWDSPKKASELTTKTGEIRSIDKGKVEFYKDRKVLRVARNESQALNNSLEAEYKYFYDGIDWYWANGRITSFEDMELI